MSGLIESAARSLVQRDELRFGITAILLGIVFVGVAGFAPLEAIHDAAHNTRHAVTFPCH
jgi:cobalt transporter subunit CbtB